VKPPRGYMRVGAIDIGTNSVRLLVADVRGDGDDVDLVTVTRAGEACRLGRGLQKSGTVDAEMAERAAAVVGDFARRARASGAARTIVGATAALRQAENGEAVATAIEERTGLPVRILSGEEEARLVYRAVVLGLGASVRRSPCVVFDLGGGSTEVVSGLGSEAGRWASLPFGAVNLTEKFVHSDPATGEEIASLSNEVGAILMQCCAYMPDITPVLAGVGGTVTVLAALDRGVAEHDPSLIDGWLVGAGRLGQLTRQVIGSTAVIRGGWPVVGTGRSDIVVAGALVIGLLAERFRSRGLVCSTQGLRYGLVRLAASEAGILPGVDPSPSSRHESH
jgi:exopolyphosphatase/guanosine-5'-triphosphate,3'-diphosphate pyrophosphatase